MKPYISDPIHIVNNFTKQCVAAIVTEVTETDFAVTMFAPHGDRGDTANRMRVRWGDTNWHEKDECPQEGKVTPLRNNPRQRSERIRTKQVVNLDDPILTEIGQRISN